MGAHGAMTSAECRQYHGPGTGTLGKGGGERLWGGWDMEQNPGCWAFGHQHGIATRRT